MTGTMVRKSSLFNEKICILKLKKVDLEENWFDAF